MPLTNDHQRQVNAHRMSKREQRTVSIIAGLGIALVIVIVISVAGGHTIKTTKGCIAAEFPSSLGVQDVDKCGQTARDLCSAVNTPGGLSGLAGQRVAAACREAGLPVS